MPMLSFSSAIIYFCGGLLIITGLSQLVVKKRSEQNYVLAAFLICVASYQIRSELIFTGYMEIYPVLSISYLSCIYSVGPLIYYYFKIVLNPHWKRNKKMWLHFVIPAILLIAEIIAFQMTSAEKMRHMFHNMNEYNFMPLSYRIIGVGIGLIHIFYMFFILKILLGMYRFKELKGMHFAIFCTVASSVIFPLLSIIRFSLNDNDYKRASLLIICIHEIIVYFLAHRYPELLDIIKKEIEKKRYEKTQLHENDADAINNRLQELMEEEKIFTNEDISLNRLSGYLNITSHQLSEFLNRHRNVNFYTFITTYRIEEAKRLLLEDADLTVLKIAFNVGFNSKSAFNSAFQKFSGTTPRNFRKSRVL